MGIFRHLLGLDRQDAPELSAAIERAVHAVEPLLKQTRKFPNAFRKPVKNALDYVRSIAYSVPGPVTTDLDAYSHDEYVHAIFPSMDVVTEAFRTSRSMQEYLHAHPASAELYALMGTRRREKNMMGMEITGEVIHRDVPQKMIYFTSHTVENPAPTEQQAREEVAWAFFDRLVHKVAERISLRKQEMLTQQQEKDVLMARLHAASAYDRPAMEAELARMLSNMQASGKAMDLNNYPEDFEAVLLNPEKYLHLNQISLFIDSMGISHENAEEGGKPIMFNELIGYDRRDWIITIVHCHDIKAESFAERLESAYRVLSL